MREPVADSKDAGSGGGLEQLPIDDVGEKNSRCGGGGGPSGDGGVDRFGLLRHEEEQASRGSDAAECDVEMPVLKEVRDEERESIERLALSPVYGLRHRELDGELPALKFEIFDVDLSPDAGEIMNSGTSFQNVAILWNIVENGRLLPFVVSHFLPLSVSCAVHFLPLIVVVHFLPLHLISCLWSASLCDRRYILRVFGKQVEQLPTQVPVFSRTYPVGSLFVRECALREKPARG